MAHRSIEALAKLAEHHGVSLTFNREIEPIVTPIEATLIDIVTAMSGVSEAGGAGVAQGGRPGTTSSLADARTASPGKPTTSPSGRATR